jgi:phosphatidylglycerophosphate synthase
VDERTDQGGGSTLTSASSAGSASGILIVCPSHVGGIAGGTLIAGLPLVRRIVLASERAGWQPVVLAGTLADAQRWLAGTSAVTLPQEGPIPTLSTKRVLLLSVTVVPQTGWLRRLLEMPVEPGHLYVDGAAAAMIDDADAGTIVAAAARSHGMSEVIGTLRATFGTAHGLPDGRGRFVLTGRGDLRAAETWLLRSLIKPTEGFMSRHVERRISLALTRRLCRTGVTPNAITLVSLGIGLAAAPFFLSAAPRRQITGALLFLAHSILDGCDGELARLKFLESRWGAMLDIGGDNLVHAAVFACMAIGWSLHASSPWPLLLGAVAVTTTLCIAAVVYGRGMRASTDGGPSTSLSRLADVVIYRDFIYLVLLLAVVGKAHWFVALTAVGAPIFLILLAWLGRRRPHRG